MFIEPKIIARTPAKAGLAAAKARGLHPLLARILAARPRPTSLEIQQMLEPKLTCLDHPLSMQDMALASKRVADAVRNGEVIGLETDHDCDGQTSHAVLYHNLVEKFKHPADKIKSYIGNRLTEGYGLSASVAERILQDEPRPTLVITADNGSSDEERIYLLKQQGIDVIVTDHHQLPADGPPDSAYACLNPTRKDCAYPDPYIAGCMVAWLLMVATRIELEVDDKLFDSLDYVAVGTVADCVSMARSANNRAVVMAGLKLINMQQKPCWQAISQLLDGPATAEDLGFRIGPLLNSDGRLATAFGSVSFLLSDDVTTAEKWISHLQQQNTERREIQRQITEQGQKIAEQQVSDGRYSLCIYLADGHPGVHGICASKIKDKFGRPTVFLAPKQGQEGVITGSIRGIDKFDVGDAIEQMHQSKDLLLSGGGHVGAGGVTLSLDKLDVFSEQFEAIAKQQLQAEDLGPVIWTDGVLDEQDISLDILETLSQLEPFGREFEPPIFETIATLQEMRPIGDGSHVRVSLKLPSKLLRGVWFNYQPTAVVGQQVHCAFSLRKNTFGGTARCEIQVAWMRGL